MAVALTLRQRFVRKVPRLIKTGRQWARAAFTGGRPGARLVFVVGSQRSGTRVPVQILDCSPRIATYSEGAAPFFETALLKPLDRVEQLARRSPAHAVVLKPICETHRVHELLDRFPESRAIWIFRNYRDAVNSASVKWTSGREAVRRLAAGELAAAGWRAGGLTAEKLDLVRRLYRDDMSLHEANAVMWLLRNGLFFDLRAAARREILLVRYEDLIAHPRTHAARMFRFLAMPMPSGCEESVNESTGSRRTFPPIAPEIRSMCEELYARLLAHYRTSIEPVSAGPEPKYVAGQNKVWSGVSSESENPAHGPSGAAAGTAPASSNKPALAAGLHYRLYPEKPEGAKGF